MAAIIKKIKKGKPYYYAVESNASTAALRRSPPSRWTQPDDGGELLEWRRPRQPDVVHRRGHGRRRVSAGRVRRRAAAQRGVRRRHDHQHAARPGAAAYRVRQGRAQRSVSVRERKEVQEVPRGLSRLRRSLSTASPLVRLRSESSRGMSGSTAPESPRYRLPPSIMRRTVPSRQPLPSDEGACPEQAAHSGAGTARLNRKPWMASQPSSRRKPRSSHGLDTLGDDRAGPGGGRARSPTRPRRRAPGP